MNKVSKKDKTFSSNKCNSVHKAAQDKTCTTTEDLCEDINSLRIKSKHVNGLINGSIVKDLTRENEPAKPTEKGKSKKGKKTIAEALSNHIDTGTIEVQPGCSSSTSDPCTSTSLDSIHSKTEPQDCKCILNNENSIDEAYLSDFDISAFIQSRCEEKKLKSSSPECSLDKLATEKEKTTEERIADSTCSKTENESSGNNADTDPDSTPISNPVIEYVEYQSELQMPLIMKIIQKDLSEPYSIYTYRYFIHNWPNLCFLAMCGDQCVGAIVCKLDIHRAVIRRGYIAMLAVDRRYRKHGLGSTLVRRAIAQMVTGGADEVVLETEITNRPALRLYEALGFVRDKRLFRYYLNGVDALRLKLWLR